MKEIIPMSTKEANRISVLEKLKAKEMKQKKAAQFLGLSVRQIRRLLKRFRKDGAAGLPISCVALPGTVRQTLRSWMAPLPRRAHATRISA